MNIDLHIQDRYHIITVVSVSMILMYYLIYMKMKSSNIAQSFHISQYLDDTIFVHNAVWWPPNHIAANVPVKNKSYGDI